MPSDDTTIILRNRRTHRVLAELPDWTTVRFREERYRSSTASIDFHPGAISPELMMTMAGGDAGIEIQTILPDGTEAGYYGTVETVRLSNESLGDITYNVCNLSNEYVSRGRGDLALQIIERTRDAEAQERYPFYETQRLVTNLVNRDQMHHKANDELRNRRRERTVFEPDIRLDTRPYMVSLTMLNQLGYLDRRLVDTTNVDHLYVDEIPGGEMIRDLYVNEMMAPNLARRQIDSTSELGSFTPGQSVLESVRWERLNNIVEIVSRAADLTLTHDLVFNPHDRTLAVRYGTKPANNRRYTNEDRLVITEQLAGDWFRLEIGDVVERVFWMDVARNTEPVETTDVICVRRELWKSARTSWRMKPTFEVYGDTL